MSCQVLEAPTHTDDIAGGPPFYIMVAGLCNFFRLLLLRDNLTRDKDYAEPSGFRHKFLPHPNIVRFLKQWWYKTLTLTSMVQISCSIWMCFIEMNRYALCGHVSLFTLCYCIIPCSKHFPWLSVKWSIEHWANNGRLVATNEKAKVFFLTVSCLNTV